jgi:hypothetical protein
MQEERDINDVLTELPSMLTSKTLFVSPQYCGKPVHKTFVQFRWSVHRFYREDPQYHSPLTGKEDIEAVKAVVDSLRPVIVEKIKAHIPQLETCKTVFVHVLRGVVIIFWDNGLSNTREDVETQSLQIFLQSESKARVLPAVTMIAKSVIKTLDGMWANSEASPPKSHLWPFGKDIVYIPLLLH